MKYNKILKQIAKKENATVKEIKREMKAAINYAGLNCTVKEFLSEMTSIFERLYIVK